MGKWQGVCIINSLCATTRHGVGSLLSLSCCKAFKVLNLCVSIAVTEWCASQYCSVPERMASLQAKDGAPHLPPHPEGLVVEKTSCSPNSKQLGKAQKAVMHLKREQLASPVPSLALGLFLGSAQKCCTPFRALDRYTHNEGKRG